MSDKKKKSISFWEDERTKVHIKFYIVMAVVAFIAWGPWS